MDKIDHLLGTALKENKIQITAQMQAQLVAYLKLLIDWNKVHNLTAILSVSDMVYLHIIDSLLLAPHLNGQRMLDVGTGAGLPGIPLAIVRPETEWLLVDKNRKKIFFLTQVIAELKLKNVHVQHSRCEELTTTDCFDSILSRALGSLQLFVQLTQTLLCPNGILIAMKGKIPHNEIEFIPTGFEISKTIELHMTGKQVIRHLICLKKKS